MPEERALIGPYQVGAAGELAAVVAHHHPALAAPPARSSPRATRASDSEISATSAGHSRVQSSTTVKMLKRQPSGG